MQIRFVSSLTAEDEKRIADALVACVSGLLSQFPIAYSLRVETSGGEVIDQNDTVAARRRATAPSTGFTH
jgi:hypothetical protein